ncbi:hypothetical protein NO1_0283 [Candidatus Termititenax aidoneus]|uniref:N-acetyltransferase domain-containing protein n=1 Tax=Termititenax aidoneus TaxID=2218524 RepID=A0A388T854_TERA1|nr:hypothetical protein NO1_0283 [Candidatus Termititenax aidoneus]
MYEIKSYNQRGKVFTCAEKEFVDRWYSLVSREFKIISLPRFYDIYKQNNISAFCLEKNGEETGVFAYSFQQDLTGKIIFSEMLVYIKPEYRGDIRLLRKYIDTAESIARDTGCDSLNIGANIGYKDQTWLKILKRWGYQDRSLVKSLA